MVCFSSLLLLLLSSHTFSPLYSTPQFPHLAHPPDYKRNPLGKLLFDAEVAECSMWFERIPYVQDWGTLMAFEDKIFEVELLDAYFEV